AVQNLLKEQVPGFEKCFVEKTANYPVTTMHRILGDHILTVAEMREGKTFEDSIAINNQPPDIWEVTGRFGYEILPHDVPYRSIVSKEIDNLLAAGTTISCGLFTNGGLRYCTPSMCTGQAAGTAAALAAKNNISPKDLDMNLLRDVLRSKNARITVREIPEEIIEPYQFMKKISKVNKKNSDVNIDEEEIGKY
ncbi:MAG: FAD-dependent oxidoreductase, partial [Candidatus Heimdallarchaeota archaeon]